MQPMTHRFTHELRKLERDARCACTICGRRFEDGDTAHSGYGANGTPIYVGDCCAPQVAETAARYRWSPPPFETPPDKASLWRYMDLAKLIGLLRDKSLYFGRLDHLGDSWEGAKGTRENKGVWNEHYLRFFEQAIRNPPGGNECQKTDQEIKAEASRLLEELELGAQIELRTTYVSCWHENENESEALWRLYCPPTTVGVAVRTTFGDLKVSFDDDLSVRLGRVKYVDFSSQFAGINDSVFRKRKSLQHEQEVRAVIRDHSENEMLGLARPVNLDRLIKEVVISPFAPAWIGSIVDDLLLRYAVSVPTRSSELLAEPFF
jgi:hypothetical protein